ncbi:hypothetical protein SmJEL517_g06306 [Synchytrium microbalum]|uniref:Ty3 transposon capsid-like protein domain-containing protein n=1 Tax=Synchytrium microbalum TaxID=1806994 RepID=A0A507BR76_9FUNG|nr:uncharacterized protein SmJEL517_g06306 [Synchytrium microbalum]TPX29961.1 hypothetical protein SmJEL517_g06306 [Synchytrium microbalum]
MKIKEPESFSGDMKDYTRWSFEVKNVISVRTSMSTDAKKVLYLGSLLTGAAHTWYRLWVDMHTVNHVTACSYAQFWTDMDATFKDPMEVSNYRKDVIESKQKNTEFNEYAIHFMNLCQKAGYNIDQQIEVFLRGLNYQTINNWHVAGARPTMFTEIVESIRQSIENFKLLQSVKGRQNVTPLSRPSSSRNPYIPGSQAPYVSSDPTKPGIFTSNPDTPTYKYRARKGWCTRCGMTDHKADKCSTYPSTASGKENYDKSVKLHGRFNSTNDPSDDIKVPPANRRPPTVANNNQRSSAQQELTHQRQTRFNTVDSDDDDGLSEADTEFNTTEESAYLSRLNMSRQRLRKSVSNQRRTSLFLTEFSVKSKDNRAAKGLALVDSGANKTMIGRGFVDQT